jgi:hypothetical protein
LVCHITAYAIVAVLLYLKSVSSLHADPPAPVPVPDATVQNMFTDVSAPSFFIYKRLNTIKEFLSQ